MISSLAQGILQAGLDDWIPLAAIEGMARLLAGGPGLREASLEAIEELLLNGLAEVGEVSDGGFLAWNQPPDDALTRIKELWEHTDPNTWGFSVWVSNTPIGDQEAQRSLPPNVT